MNKLPSNLTRYAALITVAGSFLLSSASAQTPLLHYTFDEGSGPAADSGSGDPNPGTLEGGAVRSGNAPSGGGSSISFLNDDPYAHVLGGNAPKLDGLTAFTLTTWLNVEQYTAGNNRLVAQQNGGNFGGFSWNMNATTNDGDVGPDNFRIGLFVGNNLGFAPDQFGSVFSSEDVNAHNQWVFLAVTYDGGNVNFYIGDEASAVTLLGAPQSMGNITSDSQGARFGVGFTDGAAGSDTSVIGLQDDVRVYGSALSQGDLEGVRQAIPEPSTYALFAGFGVLGLVFFRRIRAKKA